LIPDPDSLAETKVVVSAYAIQIAQVIHCGSVSLSDPMKVVTLLYYMILGALGYHSITPAGLFQYDGVIMKRLGLEIYDLTWV